MVSAVGTGVWLAAIAEDGYLVRVTALAAGAAAALLAAGIVLRRPSVIPAAICVLAAPYVAALGFEIDGLDPRSPLLAGLLFAIAELAYWSLELRGALADEPGTYLRRVGLLAALSVGTIAAGTVLLAVVEGVAARGAAAEVTGALAAVAAIALLAQAATRRTST